MASLWKRLFGRRTKATVDGDRIVQLTPAVTEYLRLYGTWGSYAAMYRKQPAVRTVISFLAKNVAQLKAKVYERVGNTDRLELDDHELSLLLARPGTMFQPPLTRHRLYRDTVSDLGIYDRAYWLKVRAPGSPRVRALRRLPPTALWPEYEPSTGALRGYRTVTNQLLSPDDLVIFPGYVPEGQGDGVPPLETLRMLLAEEWAASSSRESFWRNAARHSGVIERPLDAPPWNDETRKRFREDWQAVQAGNNNAGKTAILEEGMTWNSAAFSPKEAEFIAGRKLTTLEVMRAYHVHPDLLGYVESGGGLASVQARHRHLYSDTLAPLLDFMSDEIMAQLLPEFDAFDDTQRVYVEFNLEAKLKGSFEEEAALLTTAVGGPWMTRREARSRKNLPTDDESMEELVVPLNSRIGGGPQPAPTIPTDDPSTVPAGTANRPWIEERASELLKRHLDRQRAVLDRGRELKRDRWDRELADDLLKLALQTSAVLGPQVAQEVDGTYAEDEALEPLKELVRAQAERVNAETDTALAAGKTLDDRDSTLPQVVDTVATELVDAVTGLVTNPEQ